MSRKRVVNFTAHEKTVLALLVKRRPIIQSKLTDGKSVAKKQAAWAAITQEFNSNANVHKRETITLKRAWENMKARKVCDIERGNLLRTNCETHVAPQQEAILSMMDEVVPAMLCEIKNTLDSDGGVSDVVDSSQERDLDETFVGTCKTYPAVNEASQEHTPLSCISQDVTMQMKHMENKRKVEVEILQTRLEFEQIKKRTALLEEERSKILLEKAIIELEEVMKSTNTTLELAE